MRQAHVTRMVHKRVLDLIHSVLLQRDLTPEEETFWIQVFKQRKLMLKVLDGGDFKEELKG